MEARHRQRDEEKKTWPFGACPVVKCLWIGLLQRPLFFFCFVLFVDKAFSAGAVLFGQSVLPAGSRSPRRSAPVFTFFFSFLWSRFSDFIFYFELHAHAVIAQSCSAADCRSVSLTTLRLFTPLFFSLRAQLALALCPAGWLAGWLAGLGTARLRAALSAPLFVCGLHLRPSLVPVYSAQCLCLSLFRSPQFSSAPAPPL